MNSRLTFLRGFAIASLLTLPTMPLSSAQEKTWNVRGSLGGHGVGTIQGPTLQASAGGAGIASNIGRFTYVWNATVNLPTGTSTGVFALVFENGDVLHGSFTGASPQPGSITESLTINGGTGRFEGATGNLTLDRIVDQSTLPAFETHFGTITGTIHTPK